MNNRTVLGLRNLAGVALVLAFVLVTARAQQASPSPTPKENNKSTQTSQQSASADEQMIGNYSVTSSIEIGVRGLSVDGNHDKYRSDLNYRPGLRIFDSSFLLEQKDHRGQVFDAFLVNSSGWGGDPQGYTQVNIEKEGIYRFGANVRRVKYFNNLSNLALGQHTQNTRHQFGDYDLTFLPENEKLKFYLGYSRDTRHGPGITTYDFSRDEYAINSNQELRANNFRAGVDAKLGPIDISFLQGARYFKDDTSYTLTFPSAGNNPTNTSRIDTLFRELPTSGRHFFTRFSAHSLIAKKLDITARYIYTSSTTRFSLFERLTGRLGVSPGNIVNPEISTTSGEAKRPYGMADIGITWMATAKFRISNSFRVDNFRINGGEVLSDFLQPFSFTTGARLTPTTSLTLFQRTTKYRRFMNTTEGDYQFNSRYSFHIGYRVSHRRIEHINLDQELAAEPEEPEFELFNNRTHSFIFGLKARPISGWTIYFDGERGTSDSVFTRLENNEFTNFRVRNRVTPNKKIAFNVSLVIRDNRNPSEVRTVLEGLPLNLLPDSLDADVKSRFFTSTVDWTPDPRFSLSGGYTHLRVTSNAGIILFLANVSTLGQSQYFMRDNFFFVNTSVNPVKRLTLFASYRINRDPGQGSLVSPAPNIIIGSYPMTFQSPEARVTFKVTNRLDWNVGYQYYNYRDWFVPGQNYHAHQPYTSLRVYFGRKG